LSKVCTEDGDNTIICDYKGIITIAGIGLRICMDCNGSELGEFCSGEIGENVCRKSCDNGGECNSGDDGKATSARLYNPTGVAYYGSGKGGAIIYFADSRNNRIRSIDSNGNIYHEVGSSDGTPGDKGDNTQLEKAKLNNPLGVAVDRTGRLLVVDTGNHKIHRISSSGIFIDTIVNVAGNSTCSTPTMPTMEPAKRKSLSNTFKYIYTRILYMFMNEETCKNLESEEGIDASEATLFSPSAIAIDSEDYLFIADSGNKAIRAVRKERIYNLARDVESFGISVEEQDKLLVSDNITDTIIRFSGFYPPPPIPSPTG
jgi:hypothetical protein